MATHLAVATARRPVEAPPRSPGPCTITPRSRLTCVLAARDQLSISSPVREAANEACQACQRQSQW